jgi:hypothetical protein
MGNKGSKLCLCCCPGSHKLQEADEEKNSVILPVFTNSTEDAKSEEIHEEDHRLIHQVERAIEVFFEHVNRPAAEDMGLELIVEKENVRVYGRDTNRGFLLRSEWLIAHEPDVFIRFLGDVDLRLTWDKKMESVRRLKTIPPDYGVYYQTYRKIMLLAQRDLLYVSKTFAVGQAWADVCTSVDLAEAGEVKDVVRMRLYLGGYYVERLEKEVGKMLSRVICVSECDFGGSVPKAIVKKVSAITIPSYVREVEEALRKHLIT